MPIKNFESVTKSEEKVLKLVGEGMDNTEIAEFLHISVHTVRSHMKILYDKLRCKDRVKLALFSYKFFRRRDHEN